MDTSALEDIGLSAAEIKVFVTLLELGDSKAGKIIEKSGLQSSSAYNAMNNLISKGLVSYIKKGKIKFYKTANPETILDYIDLKKGEFLKLLPELKARQAEKSGEGAEFFKSYRGIKTMLFELLKNAKKGDIYRTFSIEDPEQYEKAGERVYRAVKQLAKEKKIIMRGIFHEKTRRKPTKTSVMMKRYVDFSMPPQTTILNDKVVIISWKDEPSGILMHSKEIARQYIDFFESLWKIAKK